MIKYPPGVGHGRKNRGTGERGSAHAAVVAAGAGMPPGVATANVVSGSSQLHLHTVEAPHTLGFPADVRITVLPPGHLGHQEPPRITAVAGGGGGGSGNGSGAGSGTGDDPDLWVCPCCLRPKDRGAFGRFYASLLDVCKGADGCNARPCAWA